MSGDVPVESIVDFLRALVRTPSRASDDDLAAICGVAENWFVRNDLRAEVIRDSAGLPLGLYAQVTGRQGGPWTVMNATLDTASFGDRATWRFDPTSAEIDDGWLHGRGAADSKAAVAIFAHLLFDLARRTDLIGTVGLLLDCDEHSGAFGGARAFFDHPWDGGPVPRPDLVLIGYPGMDRLVTGCRGFLRCSIDVKGVAAHSGSSRHHGVNAISRAVQLCARLESLALPPAKDSFPLAPQLTLTGLSGGSQSFSQVPDRCQVRVDVRLTPAFCDEHARVAIEACVAEADSLLGAVEPISIEWFAGWPSYQLPPTHRGVRAMQNACREELGFDVPTAVVGPSNIGNYLASIGVPALCGFGVRSEGVHAANERIELATIEPVFKVYRNALLALHRV